MKQHTSFQLAKIFLLALAFATFTSASADDKVQKTEPSEKSAAKEKSNAEKGWKPLFNGKDLDGWEATNFGGEGDVALEKDYVVISQGVDLSGITSTRKDLPKTNYEIEFEARRFEGSDFFIGLTFPVAESHCSLVCGGWGGGVFGLSSIDGADASENETTGYTNYTNGQWYRGRVRVTPEKIQAWLDDTQIVDVELDGKKIDVRFEMDACKPLGFANYQSTSHIRKARIRTLPKSPASLDKSAEKATE